MHGRVRGVGVELGVRSGEEAGPLAWEGEWGEEVRGVMACFSTARPSVDTGLDMASESAE